jgi:hypothetical protein
MYVVFSVVVLSYDFPGQWTLTTNTTFVGYVLSFVVRLYAAICCEALVTFLILLYGYLYSYHSHVSCLY